MGRMYGKGKGLSGSAIPYKRSAPSWLKTTASEVSGDPMDCSIGSSRKRVWAETIG